MAWLEPWLNRVTITIDKDDIDSALTDFPLMIYLSASSGINSDDVSFVFDELLSDANRKKIAVTDSSGDTELYVEIEKWDDASEEAWLWVKVPTVASGADTIIYLYYDVGEPDNTDFVGDVGSTAGETVWDSDHVLVHHLSETTGTHLDSTNNDYDGAVTGADQDATGKIDGADEFDGSGDYINLTPTVTGEIDASFMASAWVKTDTIAAGEAYIVERVIANTAFIELYRDDNDLVFRIRSIFAEEQPYPTVTAADVLDTTNLFHVVGVRDIPADKIYIYVNGAVVANAEDTTTSPIINYDFRIGAFNTGTLVWDGIIDEVRLVAANKGAAWIKASYESERDHILDFSGESNPTYAGMRTLTLTGAGQ